MDVQNHEEIHKKNRRIKSKVKKQKKQKRDMTPDDRSIIIEYMNAKQDLMERDVGEGDGECKRLCDMINETFDEKDPLAEYQVAGFFSFLVRTAMKSDDWIQKWWEAKAKKGEVNIEPRPIYTDEFRSRIQERYLRDKEEAEQRARDHARIKAEREQKKREQAA